MGRSGGDAPRGPHERMAPATWIDVVVTRQQRGAHRVRRTLLGAAMNPLVPEKFRPKGVHGDAESWRPSEWKRTFWDLVSVRTGPR